jgi:Secretion system C-terminal sorting domain
MTKKLLSFISLSIGFLGISQSTIYFKYDEAGNQRYRGPEFNAKQASESTPKVETQTASLTQQPASLDEKTFWSNIRIYPVPVKDILTIDWNEKVDNLITEISLYEQNTVHWVFQSKKISSLDKSIKINMSQKYMGVYILTFTLKDGRRISKNITKL